MNLQRLYWTLQIGGWALYAAVQIVASLLASVNASSNRIYFLIYESLICLLVTHLFRIIFHPRKWLGLSMALLVPRVLVVVFSMGVVVYFLRIPLSFALSLFDPGVLFDPSRIFGLTFVYAVIFFLGAFCILLSIISTGITRR